MSSILDHLVSSSSRATPAHVGVRTRVGVIVAIVVAAVLASGCGGDTGEIENPCVRWRAVCRPLCDSVCNPGGCEERCGTHCEPVCVEYASGTRGASPFDMNIEVEGGSR